jgi:hypothetical protein
MNNAAFFHGRSLTIVENSSKNHIFLCDYVPILNIYRQQVDKLFGFFRGASMERTYGERQVKDELEGELPELFEEEVAQDDETGSSERESGSEDVDFGERLCLSLAQTSDHDRWGKP